MGKTVPIFPNLPNNMQLATDNDGNNLFHALGALGDAREATKLLSSTPKKVVSSGLVARNSAGMTPLHIAALAGRLKVLNQYLDAAPEDTENIKCTQGYLFRDRLTRKINHGEIYYQIQRFMRLDKLGLEDQQFDTGNVDAFKVAASNSSLVMIGQSRRRLESLGLSADGFEFPRSLFTVIKGVTCELDLGDSNPTAAATSNNHSIVLTSDGRIFSWGKNVNGILGVDVEDRILTQPTQVRGSFMAATSTLTHINKFSALSSGSGNGNSNASYIGVKGIACSDFFSACHTNNKVWVWGANRGQMMHKEAKNAISEEPLLVYESPVNIKKIAACDSALALLLENKQVAILKNDRCTHLAVGKSKNGSEVLKLRARGDFLAVLTSDYRMLRFNLGGGANSNVHGDTMWTIRHELDIPAAFDVSESGIFVIATRRGVYRVEEKGNVTELRQFRGVAIRDIVFNLHGYMAIATLGVSIIPQPSIEYSVMWGLRDSSRGDLNLEFDNGQDRIVIKIHRAILYARCPTLRTLLESKKTPSEVVVGVPGGSTVFKLSAPDTLIADHAPEKSIKAFVEALYLSTDQTSRERLKKLTSELTVGPEMYEFSALQRLMTRSLASGLWEARTSQIMCDTLIKNGETVHSAVLSAASPVLAANLKRQENREASILEFGIESSITMEDVIFYIYTGEINAEIDLLRPIEQAERVFSLWLAADVLMIPSLVAHCEDRIIEMLSYELLAPFLEIVLSLCKHDDQRLLSMLVGCAIECLDFILPALKEMPNDQVTRLESAVVATFTHSNVDTNMLNEVSLKFNSLKSQSQLRSLNTGTTKSKGRKLSSTLDRSEVSQLIPTASSKSTQISLSSSIPRNAQKCGGADTIISPNKSWGRTESPLSPPASADASSSFVGDDWIQAGKKPRAGSSSNSALASDQTASSSSTRVSPSTRMSPAARSVSPANPTRSSPVSSSSSLATPTRTVGASSPVTPSPLASLPKLGSSLPKLGSALPKLGETTGANKPSNGKKSSKAKFKNSKNISFYENVAQLERDSEPAPSATPWKAIPVVQTKGVLERLEKASKSRKPGSVWSS